MRYTVRVTINGTSVNPFKQFGLARNPFPAIAERRADLDKLNQVLADLEAGVRTREHLLEIIAGSSERFKQLCLAHYRPGESKSFTIWWMEGR